MFSLPDKADDAALLARLQAGETLALQGLYQRHKDGVYRFALAFCGTRHLAADVTQETFLQLVRRPTGYDPAAGPLGAYLAGIARNLARRALGETAREEILPAADDPAGEPLPGDPAGEPLTRLLQDETAERVRRAVYQLPPHYREVVILVELQDTSYASTAQILGIELGTVRSRLARARALLARALADLSPREAVA
jgi:RNA polymerase sigma-70 factor (ECF subfamily)